MVKIEFQEPDTNEWRAWLRECEREQAKHTTAVEAGENSEVKKAVYKGERHGIKGDVFMNHKAHFHGKCAYCESRIAADQPGDIEHFRPKDAVMESNGEPVMVDTPMGRRSHPGYYWLAYSWRNLLPSCEDCNRPSKQKSQGKRIGKWEYFPVKDFRATKPGEEAREVPLLIHPVWEDPGLHLKILDTGMFEALTGRGQACIDVFGLNVREALVDERARTYRNARSQLAMLLPALVLKSSEAGQILAELLAFRKGQKAYSAAGRLAISENAHILGMLAQLFA